MTGKFWGVGRKGEVEQGVKAGQRPGRGSSYPEPVSKGGMQRAQVGAEEAGLTIGRQIRTRWMLLLILSIAFPRVLHLLL